MCPTNWKKSSSLAVKLDSRTIFIAEQWNGNGFFFQSTQVGSSSNMSLCYLLPYSYVDMHAVHIIDDNFETVWAPSELKRHRQSAFC